MENQDHRTAMPSGHVSHGVHLCHKCGWPFPNPHPSAKHRRAHKKVCGTIEGYKLTESEAPATHSDDERLSDEDRRTPSPKIDNKSWKEPIASLKSTRSEDEDFADAMTEFLDSSPNPGLDQGLEEAAQKLGKNVQELPGFDATRDASEPLDDPQLLESALKSVDATPYGSKPEENSIGLNEPIGQESDPIKSKTLVSPIGENVEATEEEVLMSNNRQDICVKENEHANVSEILTDAVEPSNEIIASQSRISESDSVKSAVQEGEGKTCRLSEEVGVESVEADSKVSSSSTLEPELLEGARNTPGHAILESTSNGADVKTSCPLDQESDQCQADGKASEVVSLDRKLEPSDESETDIFLQVPSLQKTDTKDIDGGCQNESAELCKTEVKEKEDVHLLSVAKDVSSLHNAELMVQDYKDYRSLKSNLALDLGAGDELVSSAQDDVKSTLEEQQSRIEACKPEESLLGPPSILDASRDDGKVPTDGKMDLDGPEVINDDNFGSCGLVSAPATLEPSMLNFEPTNSLSVEDESSQNSFQQCKPLTYSDKNSIAPEEVRQAIPTILDASGDVIRKDDDKVSIDRKVDLDKDDDKVSIDRKVDLDGSEVINDEKLGYSGSVSTPATLESPILDSEPTISLSMEDESSQELGDSGNNSSAPCEGEEVLQTVITGGSDTFYDCVMDKTKMSSTAENESREGHLQDKYSADTKIGVGCSENSFGGGYDHPDFEKSGTKCLDSARHGSMEETEGEPVKITGGGGAEDDQTGYSLGVGGDSLHDIAGSEHREEDTKDKMVNIEPVHDSSMEVLESTNAVGVDERNGGNVEQVSSVSGKGGDSHHDKAGSEHREEDAKDKHDSSMEVLESTNAAASVDERNRGNVEQVSSISGKHVGEGSQEKHYEGSTWSESGSLPVYLNSGNSATPEDNNTVDATSTSGVSPLPLKGENDDKITKQQDGVATVDRSVTSSSRTDSLEANWGSVSVLSIQSESAVPESGAPQKTKIETNHEKSDSFEPPSFMTLVESGSGLDQRAASEIENVQNAQHPKSEALKAGWFPSLNNVVTESQGRKKNEEIIAKVTNWSTGGKQHTPLKNLLGEAKSPNAKQVPSAMQKDETATDNTTAAKVTTVNSILRSETPTDQKEAEKEWNSPARYPVDIKKEKKKGKAYWVPFVCCSSVH